MFLSRRSALLGRRTGGVAWPEERVAWPEDRRGYLAGRPALFLSRPVNWPLENAELVAGFFRHPVRGPRRGHDELDFDFARPF